MWFSVSGWEFYLLCYKLEWTLRSRDDIGPSEVEGFT